MQGNFSKVKEDISSINRKINQASNSLQNLEARFSDTTTKEEFYEFIQELNEELNKLEKNIATQSSLERLRAALNTQLKQLGEELKQRRKISQKLKTVDKLEITTKEIKKKISNLTSIEKKLTVIEKNYVNWKEFLDKIEQMNEEERYKQLESLRKEFDNKLSKKEKESEKYVKIKEKELKKLIADQDRIIRSQERRISKLEQRKPSKGRKFEYIFPFIVVIVIAVLLTLGILFFGEDIFSPELYPDQFSVNCQDKFQCDEISEGIVLINCKYDYYLQECHCDASSIEDSDCLNP